jgi:hypothetical protein
VSKNHPLIRKKMELREIARELNGKDVPTKRVTRKKNSTGQAKRLKINKSKENYYGTFKLDRSN